MEMMDLLKLLGILIVIIGFALKLDSILIIVVAAVVTAIVSGLGVEGLLETFGGELCIEPEHGNFYSDHAGNRDSGKKRTEKCGGCFDRQV